MAVRTPLLRRGPAPFHGQGLLPADLDDVPDGGLRPGWPSRESDRLSPHQPRPARPQYPADPAAALSSFRRDRPGGFRGTALWPASAHGGTGGLDRGAEDAARNALRPGVPAVLRRARSQQGPHLARRIP